MQWQPHHGLDHHGVPVVGYGKDKFGERLVWLDINADAGKGQDQVKSSKIPKSQFRW